MVQTLGIDNLTAARMLPPDIIRAAAAADVHSVGLWLAPFLGGPAQERPILTDKAMRDLTTQALRDHGVTCHLTSGWLLAPDSTVEDYRRKLDVSAELGARYLCIVSRDPDMLRATDNAAALCDLAAAADMLVALEFSPNTEIAALGDAVRFIETVSHEQMKLVIDALHLERTGGTAAEVAALPPGLLAFMQICDGPRGWFGRDAYRHESIFERMLPGQGEFPLQALLDAMPQEDFLVTAEVPLQRLEELGVDDAARVKMVADATRSLRAFR